MLAMNIARLFQTLVLALKTQNSPLHFFAQF